MGSGWENLKIQLALKGLILSRFSEVASCENDEITALHASYEYSFTLSK